MTTTVKQFFDRFPNDTACLEHLFNKRFGQDYTCPKCERDTKWYPLKAERAYSCQWCGHHIHPTVGTPFEKSRTSLQLWFYAIYLFTTTRHGVSAKEMERQLGVTYKCAWRMAREIRKYMASKDDTGKLAGVVEVDEAIVGGVQKGAQGSTLKGNKAMIIGAVGRGGNVVTEVYTERGGLERTAFVVNHIEKGSKVYTDASTAYKNLPKYGYDLHQSKHYLGEHGKMAHIEGYWNQIKKSIRGTHVFVSRKYLEIYLGEFNFRYNNRKEPDAMFGKLMDFSPNNI